MSLQLAPCEWAHRYGPGPEALRGWHTEPRGLPVLAFIHGNGLCARAYTPLLNDLVQDFDLILIDAPGHGRSDNPGTRFAGWQQSADWCSDALETLLPRFGEVPRLGLGHSFGGMVLMHSMSARPELLRGSVLLDPVLFGPWMLRAAQVLEPLGLMGYHALARSTAKRRNRFDSRSAARARWQNNPVYGQWHPESLDGYVQWGLVEDGQGGVRLACDRALESEIYSRLPHRFPQVLRALRRPAEAIVGRRSYGFVRLALPGYLKVGPYLRSEWAEGGHNFCLERPAETAQLVRGAVDRVMGFAAVRRVA